MMRSLRYRCPNSKCRVVLSIPEKMVCHNVRCAGCGQSFVVPPTLIKTNAISSQKLRKSA